MKRIVTSLLVFWSIADSVAQERKGMPSDSLDLLSKLQQFESEQRINFDAVIKEKRDAVAAVLQQHLQRETKAGNLDSALELRKAIESLATADLPEAATEEPAADTSSEKEAAKLSEKELEDLNDVFHGKWNYWKGGYFTVNKKLSLVYQSESVWKYEIEENGTFVLHAKDNKTARLQLDLEKDELNGTDFEGKKVTVKRRLKD